MGRMSRTELKYFILSFFAAILSLAFVFLFLMSGVGTPLPNLAGEGAASTPTPYQPIPEDALNLLILGGQPGGVNTFLLVRFDPASQRVILAPIPAGTLLTHNQEGETLAEAVRFGGAAYARGALASTLGITIDRFAALTPAAFAQAVGIVGSFELNLEDGASIRDGGVSLTLGSGVHLLDGRAALALISYEGYPGGEQERLAMLSAIAAAAVNQRMDIANSTLFAEIFGSVVNLIETDITFSDFAGRVSAAQYLAGLAHPVAHEVWVVGSLDPQTGAFILSDTAIAYLSLLFV